MTFGSINLGSVWINHPKYGRIKQATEDMISIGGKWNRDPKPGMVFWYVKTPFYREQAICKVKLLHGFDDPETGYQYAAVQVLESDNPTEAQIGEELRINNTYTFPTKPFIAQFEDEYGKSCNFFSKRAK